MPSDRERAASLTHTITDEFRRSGLLPPELVRDIQAAHARRTGGILMTDQVEGMVREYVERLLTKVDAERPIVHGDDSIDQAIDVLMCFSPKKKAKEWAEAVAVIERAWRDGALSPAQIAQLDTLNENYARAN